MSSLHKIVLVLGEIVNARTVVVAVMIFSGRWICQRSSGVVMSMRDIKKSFLKYFMFSILRRMRWAGHVVRMGRRGLHIGFWWGGQKERDH
jgi:hypothetical protein